MNLYNIVANVDSKIFTDGNISAFALALAGLAFIIAVLAASRIGKIIQGEIKLTGNNTDQKATDNKNSNLKVVQSAVPVNNMRQNSADVEDGQIVAAISGALMMLLQSENQGNADVTAVDPLVGFRIKSIRKL